jgi:hypothetical protein
MIGHVRVQASAENKARKEVTSYEAEAGNKKIRGLSQSETCFSSWLGL